MPIPNEDMIDFPCSPAWVHHYAREGLTQDYPPEYYYPSQERIGRLEAKIVELQDLIKGKKITVRHITVELGERKVKEHKHRGAIDM